MSAVPQLVSADPLDNQGSVCEPWLYGVVSLYEMLQFYADVFIKQMMWLNGSESRLVAEGKPQAFLKPEYAARFYSELGGLMTDAAMYELTSIAQQAQRMMKTLEAKKMLITCGEMREDLKNLRTRCDDEFSKHFFLHLTLKESGEYQNPLKGWEEVANRFYRVRFNIEESSKCLALQRYGAAVFHALQVAEYGVIQLAKLLRVEGDRPGWGALKRLSAILEKPYSQRSDLERKHSTLLDRTVHLAVIVRDNWRHKLDHVNNQIVWVENDFSEDVARGIISAIQAFMRQLAKMPNEPKPKFSIRNAL